MGQLKEWLKTNPLGKIGTLVFVVAALLLAYHSVRGGSSEVIDRTRSRLFMDSETGKTFTVELQKGMTFPVTSPETGKATGYPPEACYWNADGTAKTTPTYVILNSYLGKPGPTFCPDCGRLVVENNPPPHGQAPPPTRQEYQQLYGLAGKE
jgi:hypothetical protein